MASEGEILAPPMPANNLPGHRSRGKENRETDDGDSGSLHPLDPLRRRWMITASNCDYSGLIQLLKEDNKLASFKDFTSGYTALHWAAKFGSLEIIKLIAGTCGVDPDIKTHSGYTPLHVAAIHGHERIMQLLTITYGANANIRDYSGRLAHQYLKRPEPLTNSSKSVKNSGGRSNKMTSGSLNNGSHRKSDQKSKGSSNREKNQIHNRNSESVFVRIGSLNTRMRRTAAALTGNFGVKSWGSAESLPDNNLMPPPSKNTFGRKKRSKKALSTPPIETSHHKDSDSDSAYGFGV